MRTLLLLLLPVAALAAEHELHAEVEASCERLPTSVGLLHLKCGPTRLLVVQPHEMQGDAHEEILDSLLELVPGAVSRAEVTCTAPNPCSRTRLSQGREQMEKGEVSVALSLTTDPGTGRSVACLYGLTGQRGVQRREEGWCDSMVRLLLPPAPEVVHTIIEVQEPELLGKDL